MPGRAAPDDGAPLTAGFAVSAVSANSTRAAAATSTADAAGTVAADGRPHPWYRRIRLDALWTVILLVPLFFVIRSDDMPVLLKTVGAAGILGFAGLYIWATTTMPIWPVPPTKMSILDELRPIAGRLILLTAMAAVSGPSLNWWYEIFYLPYFCAIILYATTLRVGLTLSGGLCLLTVVVFALFAPRANIAGMAAGCSFSSVAIALGRIGADVQERRQVKERELAAAAEREEIGRDVHDLLGHSLTVLTLKAEVAHRLVRSSPEAAERELAEIVDLSRAALADVRATVTRLRVPDLAGQMKVSRTAFAAAGLGAHKVNPHADQQQYGQQVGQQAAQKAGLFFGCHFNADFVFFQGRNQAVVQRGVGGEDRFFAVVAFASNPIACGRAFQIDIVDFA